MEEPYVPSHMEEQISREYIKRGIIHPEDLTVSNIISRFELEIFHHSYVSFRIEENGCHFIFMNTKLPMMEFKKVFFHELCHVIRHEGEQDHMPYPFKELQEWEADNFVKYAMIPYHMIHLTKDRPLPYIAELFDAPIDLCEERLIALAGRKPYKRGHIFRQLVPALLGC
ncbi:ImmA/IrrE family metallo-endopeptidase [Priestia endophytica]|jgi:IrrE N-terminal-like domain|uniref:IrrE N-terminal-like domain-containing protein n=1 Tax=Priestia endophytica TaxID=135735 RepID=A0AAX1Q5L6_9BACI|nr:ImmA/IrrE family metallo-endopeptidase [Priestia endophytica]RAS75209.1 hypothetical protein A3864_16205 [Priestia endophytica]